MYSSSISYMLTAACHGCTDSSWSRLGLSLDGLDYNTNVQYVLHTWMILNWIQISTYHENCCLFWHIWTRNTILFETVPMIKVNVFKQNHNNFLFLLIIYSIEISIDVHFFSSNFEVKTEFINCINICSFKEDQMLACAKMSKKPNISMGCIYFFIFLNTTLLRFFDSINNKLTIIK